MPYCGEQKVIPFATDVASKRSQAEPRELCLFESQVPRFPRNSRDRKEALLPNEIKDGKALA